MKLRLFTLNEKSRRGGQLVQERPGSNFDWNTSSQANGDK